MGRRANGEGSIYQAKDGRWRSVLTLGLKSNGKPNRKYFNGRTQADVRAKMQTHRERYASGQLVDPSRETVAQHINEWLEHIQKRRAPTTEALYRSIANQHVIPRIGSMPLQKLTPAAVQRFADALATEVKAGRMRQLAFAVLTRALKHAKKLRKIVDTPAAEIEKPTHQQRQIQPFEPSEAQSIITSSIDSRWHVVYVLGLATGMRIGEICGLKWDAVDLKKKTLTVRQQVVIVSGKGIVKSPKTESSVRTIELPEVAVRALIGQRAILMKEGLAASEYVCPAPDGGLLSRTNFSARAWKPMLKKLGIAARGFHHARHTYATLALTAGVPAHIVSRVLGHEKPSTTLDIYAHVLKGQQQQATRVINSLFG